MAKWSELPRDILERISSFCIIHDHIRMQYVCKSWRSILKNTNRELPFLMMLPNDDEEDTDARDFFSLSKQKIHTVHLLEIRGKRCCGSFRNGWLMIVDENLDVFLFHPWSKRRIDLPHDSTFRANSLIGSSWGEIRDLGILKAAVSDDGKVVVIAYGLGLWFLAFCRIGDDVYTHIDINPAVEDVIYHKGNFYLFTGKTSLYLLHIEEEEDGSSPHIEELTVRLENDFKIPYRTFGYLVPDVLTDSMFVISRDIERIGEGNDSDEEEDLPHKTVHFDIFMVSLEESKTLKRFKKVENLGDRVLFLGHNSPIVVLACELPGFEGNRIYFADSRAERYYDGLHGCRDSGVFSLDDGTVEELFAERFHPTLSPPIWIATPPYSSSEIFEESSYAHEVST
eukprot:TRINITY_DN8927_c0_g1_i2.p1 TRINITY_DN8927_c0_g1~~TRINITY_DN8927_c0_g1_i2.p1  ORF type:complete len:426 (+),score=50.03 TRINITY_DN8927_c0_g1_i2:89-1279(+)